jgi:CAAX amino terminal protease family.
MKMAAAVPVTSDHLIAEPPTRVWKKIGTYYGLTLGFSGVFDALILHAHSMTAGNRLYVTGAMWSPALAAFVTKTIFRERIRDLPWRFSTPRFAWMGYWVPLAYATPLYLFVLLTGLGAFNFEFIRKIAADFGLENSPGVVLLAVFVLLTASFGLVGTLSRALGEEIGWRGFLVPELAKVVSLPGVALISGGMWAIYHYPVLIFGDYNAGTPVWYGLSCFTLMVLATSFIMAWLTLRSNSLWPAAILHAAHNLFIQQIFTPLTRDTGWTKYIIDEFGAGMVITIAIAALLLCRDRLPAKTP